jgi:hypothetical protein
MTLNLLHLYIYSRHIKRYAEWRLAVAGFVLAVGGCIDDNRFAILPGFCPPAFALWANT